MASWKNGGWKNPLLVLLSSLLLGAILIIVIAIPRTAAPFSPVSEPAPGSTRESIVCRQPYKAEVGKAFLLQVSLSDEPTKDELRARDLGYKNLPSGLKQQLRTTAVKMDKTDSIMFQPDHFNLVPGQIVFVTTTVKSANSGIAFLNAFPDNNEHDMCAATVDFGFTGRLEAAPIELQWHDQSPLSIQVVDSAGHPISNRGGFLMNFVSDEAKLNGMLPGTSVPSVLGVGKTLSDPIRVSTQRLSGGVTHVLVTLSVGDNVIAQSNLSIPVVPPWWLPPLLAIFGALLYASYNFFAQNGTGKSFVVVIFAGIIAWLFANFDLLGLKLDPNNLRTYAILGFLFSFLGVDAVLKPKFTRQTQPPGDSAAKEPTSD